MGAGKGQADEYVVRGAPAGGAPSAKVFGLEVDVGCRTLWFARVRFLIWTWLFEFEFALKSFRITWRNVNARAHESEPIYFACDRNRRTAPLQTKVCGTHTQLQLT